MVCKQVNKNKSKVITKRLNASELPADPELFVSNKRRKINKTLGNFGNLSANKRPPVTIRKPTWLNNFSNNITGSNTDLHLQDPCYVAKNYLLLG